MNLRYEQTLCEQTNELFMYYLIVSYNPYYVLTNCSASMDQNNMQNKRKQTYMYLASEEAQSASARCQLLVLRHDTRKAVDVHNTVKHAEHEQPYLPLV